MDRLKRCIMVLALLSAVGIGWAEGGKTEADVFFSLDLVDGSRIIGVPGIKSVSIVTPYAKMDIALEQILSIKMKDDHERAEIELRNGDKMQGVVTLRPLDIETIVGHVSIGIEHIRSIEVHRNGRGSVPAELRRGLVLHYAFNKERTTVEDDSGQGNHGVIHGAELTTDEERTSVCRFDGVDDWVGLTCPALRSGSKEFAVTAWIRAEDWKGGWANTIYHQMDHDGQWGDGLLFHVSDRGALALRTSNAGGWANRASTDDGTIPVKEWCFVAVVADGHKGILYVNGQRRASASLEDWNSDGARKYHALGVFHGKGHDSDSLRFHGAMDDVSIYDTALSADDIKQLYEVTRGE